MKKLLKFIGFGFLALIILGIIAVACTDTNTETSEPATVEPVKEEPKQEEKKEVKQETKKPAAKKNNPGINLAEFKEIKNGMSYEEVVKIVGGEGEVQSEVGEEGDQYYTVAYSFQGEKGFGANAILMFQGGKLNTKSQAGLK